MGQLLSKFASWVLPKKENRLDTLRWFQCFLTFAWIICIALAVIDSGRWSYESLKATVALGCELTPSINYKTLWFRLTLTLNLAFAVAFTVIIFIAQVMGFDKPIRRIHPIYREMPVNNIRSTILLVLRVLGDLGVAVLWGMAFVTSWFAKKTNFQKLFDEPPYAEWYCSVAADAIEWFVFHSQAKYVDGVSLTRLGPSALFIGTALMMISNYRSGPPADPLDSATVRQSGPIPQRQSHYSLRSDTEIHPDNNPMLPASNLAVPNDSSDGFGQVYPVRRASHAMSPSGEEIEMTPQVTFGATIERRGMPNAGLSQGR
ncbi:MAG: hypothetical protein Q9222_007845 [Ikaeria aurantiellina]